MRLLIISNMYPSDQDPVYGTFVKVFADKMAIYNREGKTQLIAIRGRDGGYWKKLKKYGVFYACILYQLLFYQYDLIYVHTITYPIVPIRIASFFRRKLPLVFNVHGGDVLTRGKLAFFLRQRSIPLLKRAKMIVSPSVFFRTILLREFPFLPSEKIVVSPSGGIASFFYEGVAVKQYQPSLTIGYVSRIDEAKGWDTFLRAIAQLRQEGISCLGVIVGRGAKESEMRNMISELSLQDHVHYKGPVAYEALPDVYRSFDLFVFPTCLEESLGLVGLEAMACGKPVIGSKIGGLTDYIEEGKNGFFFCPGDADDLVVQIKKYMSLTVEQKNEMAASAFQKASRYKSDNIQLSLYKKLINIS